MLCRQDSACPRISSQALCKHLFHFEVCMGWQRAIAAMEYRTDYRCPRRDVSTRSKTATFFTSSPSRVLALMRAPSLSEGAHELLPCCCAAPGMDTLHSSCPGKSETSAF